VEIEKIMTVAAPAAKIWEMLLDPSVMAGCVPGMKSIEIVSDTEYVAVMHVKISFISAKFKLRTKIVEQRAPTYLRSEGTGEDAAVASSLKQQSEVFLEELPDGRTELKIKVKAEVLGRLGTFGLGVMKTKADRMWEEFGQKLAARLEGGEASGSDNAADFFEPTGAVPIPPRSVDDRGAPPLANGVARMTSPFPSARDTADSFPSAVASEPNAKQGWLARWWSRADSRPTAERSIRIELTRNDTAITIYWPLEAASECTAFVRDCLRGA